MHVVLMQRLALGTACQEDCLVIMTPTHWE